MNSLKFSIIIPAYNVENYIDTCLQSVLKQEYDNYEIILIDDGSTDSTSEICDKYAADDSRVIVVHQKNEGVSGARNAGIKKAGGDYIGFLDPDDYYTADALQRIADCIIESNCPDVFIGRLSTFSEGTDFSVIDSEINADKISGKKTEQVISYLLSIPFLYTHCRYFTKRRFITDNNLFFVEGLRHEDEAWTPLLLSTAVTFCALEEPFYVYRLHSNSFMTTNSIKKQLDKLRIASFFYDKLKSYKETDIVYYLLENRIEQLTLTAVSESYNFDWNEMGIIGRECRELYRKHPAAFAKLNKLKKLSSWIGWVNAVRFFLLRIRCRKALKICLHSFG